MLSRMAVLCGLTPTACLVLVSCRWCISQELPATHVCRGLFLGERSPFLQVASAEKVKKSEFFHAPVASRGPQQLFLSKFKLPVKVRARQTRAAAASVASSLSQQENATTTDWKQGTEDITASGVAEDVVSPSSTPALLAAIVDKLDAMQCHTDARFDKLEAQLSHLVTRMARLEAKVV